MFMVMTVHVSNGVWHEEHFEQESDAKAYANHAFKNGLGTTIELWRKTRSGYELVKKARLTKKEATARFSEYVAEDAPYFC